MSRPYCGTPDTTWHCILVAWKRPGVLQKSSSDNRIRGYNVVYDFARTPFPKIWINRRFANIRSWRRKYSTSNSKLRAIEMKCYANIGFSWPAVDICDWYIESTVIHPLSTKVSRKTIWKINIATCIIYLWFFYNSTTLDIMCINRKQKPFF